MFGLDPRLLDLLAANATAANRLADAIDRLAAATEAANEVTS